MQYCHLSRGKRGLPCLGLRLASRAHERFVRERRQKGRRCFEGLSLSSSRRTWGRLRTLARASEDGGDYYDELAYNDEGMKRSAKEIKDAYRELARQYHPDVNKEPGAEDKFKAINNAYEALLGDRKGVRGRRDAERERGREEDQNVFTNPTGPANYVFVNEAYCRGEESCPDWCCCVKTAPEAFQFNEETGRAQLKDARSGSGSVSLGGSDEDGDYQIYLGVSQCPQSCLHFVSRDQQRYLQELQKQMDTLPFEREMFQQELDFLLSVANFENNRWSGPS